MRVKGAVVLITGASSGIGSATALAFARRRARLVICARRAEPLHEVAERCRQLGAAGVVVVQGDVSQHSDVQRFVEAALDEFHRVDVLVNNAGSGWRGRLEEMPEADVRRILDTNVLGAIWSTQAVLPVMVERHRGVIINVSSVVGFRGVPYSAVYSASKYALAGLSHALRGELSGTGVKVSVVYPAGTRTNFGVAATPERLRYPAEWVAGTIVRAVRFPRRDVIVPPFRLGLWLEPFLGGLLDHVLGELRRARMPELARPRAREVDASEARPRERRSRRSRAG